jgi:hypothetical protein
MATKYSILFPALFGGVSAALMVWDIHNLHVIEHMGMAWDTGAPMWPYQTPRILMILLNAPAYIVANPISNLLGLIGPTSYFAIFPATLAWWWLAGIIFDRRLLNPAASKRRMKFAFSVVLALFFYIGGAYSTMDTFRWWHTYGFDMVVSDYLLLLRSATPAIWCFLLGTTAAFSAARLARLKRSGLPILQ